MEKAFQDMVFEWEFLHPKDSTAVERERDLNCFNSQPPAEMGQVKEPKDEAAGEEIHHEQTPFSDEKLGINEAVSPEKEIAFEVEEEDDSDLEVPNLLFKEEEEEDQAGLMSEWIDTEAEVKDGREAFKLRKWLKSALMAAATLSIFVLGNRRTQLMGNNRRNQLGVCKKEEMKDLFVQHPRTAASSFSWRGHHDERF